MKIGIAGIGGIGSNVAVHLVRSGMNCIKIVDFDCVEASNLNRQFYFADQIGRRKTEMLAANLKRINPSTIVERLELRLTPETMVATFADCDVVVEGLDARQDKKHLLEALAGSGQPVISACGIAGSDTAAIRRKKVGNCTIIGDFQTDCGDHPIYAHKVAAIAAIMAGEVLKQRGNK